MPNVGDTITRDGQTYEYLGYGHWSEVVVETSITGDVPLPDGASTSGQQSSSAVQQQGIQNSIGELIKQLKINNLHLSLITDHEIEKTEIN